MICYPWCWNLRYLFLSLQSAMYESLYSRQATIALGLSKMALAMTQSGDSQMASHSKDSGELSGIPDRILIQSESIRPYICQICGKRFKLNHHLKQHTRIHSGERPFSCGQCGKRFTQLSSLKYHKEKCPLVPHVGAVVGSLIDVMQGFQSNNQNNVL